MSDEKDLFFVLALDHAPALIVVQTDDENVAFRTAVKYCAQQGSRVVVAKGIHNGIITQAQAVPAHAKYVADDALVAAAIAATAREENERTVKALLDTNPPPPASDDAGKKGNADKRR